MAQSPFFAVLVSLFLIQCFYETKGTQEKIATLPEDINATISPGLVIISWDCNITFQKTDDYSVTINTTFQTTVKLRDCPENIPVGFELHRGVTIDIQNANTIWTKMFFPEGNVNFAAENLTCSVYNVTKMNCSWNVVSKAPPDVIYYLSIFDRHSETELTCPRYGTDSRGRRINCLFDSPQIEFAKRIYAFVTGNSSETVIRFTDLDFIPLDKEILSPPRNFRMNETTGTDTLVVSWEQPQTKEYKASSCFEYQICINEQSFITEKNLNTYTMTKSHLKKPSTMKLRAKYIEPCATSEWGEWTTQLQYGQADSPGFTANHLIILFTILTVVTTLIIIVVCLRFKVFKKIFPPIPQPVNKMQDFVQHKGKGKQAPDPLSIEKLAKKEDPECVFTSISEVQSNVYVNY